MAGTDSVFSAPGTSINNNVSINVRDDNMGNSRGDVVDNSEGNNPINGSSGETALEGKDVSKATITKRPQWDTSQDPLWPNS